MLRLGHTQLPPVIGHEEPEVTDVGGIFREDDVAGELARGEPEGEVGRLAELELGVDPVGNSLLSHAPHLLPQFWEPWPDSCGEGWAGRGRGAGGRGPTDPAVLQGPVWVLLTPGLALTFL